MVKAAYVGKVLLGHMNNMLHPSSFFKDDPDTLVDVCIFTEGTYPFVKGGVSSVIHQVIENHPNITFGIVHIAWDNTAPEVNLFPKCSNIKWVNKLLLNNPDKKITHNRVSRKILREFLSYSVDLQTADHAKIKEFYNKFVNPYTRKVNFQHIITDAKFFDVLIEEYIDLNMTLNELYWLQKEYIGLATTLLDHKFPKAKVYHSHTNGYAGLAASLASIQHGKNFILTEHSLYIRDVLQEVESIYRRNENVVSGVRRKIWDKWFKGIGNITYKCAYKNTYLYEQISHDAEGLGSDYKRTVIIPNGIDYKRFEVARHKQDERQNLRFKKDVVWKLGFIGRIVPVKGVKDLILAISLLRHKLDQKFEVHLIGPTEEDKKYYQECVELTQEKGLVDLVFFHGPQDVAKFLEEIDLVVMSSLSEALPVVVLESMAAGVPIVSTNVGSVQDILISPLTFLQENSVVFEAGTIVPAQNPEALSQSIVDTLNDQPSYDRYRVNGPKRVLHSFQTQQIMQKYSQLYLEHL